MKVYYDIASAERNVSEVVRKIKKIQISFLSIAIVMEGLLVACMVCFFGFVNDKPNKTPIYLAMAIFLIVASCLAFKQLYELRRTRYLNGLTDGAKYHTLCQAASISMVEVKPIITKDITSLEIQYSDKKECNSLILHSFQIHQVETKEEEVVYLDEKIIRVFDKSRI